MTATAHANAEKKQPHRWKRGESGNPRGSVKGSRHRVSVLCERLLESDAEDVVRAVIAAAKGGDMLAARIIVERILPKKTDMPIKIKLGEIRTIADATLAMATVVEQVAAGEITPSEATEVGALLSSFARNFELLQFETRLLQLEEQMRTRGSK